MDSELNDALGEICDIMNEDHKEYETQNEAWWNTLSQEERENAFYAVAKRIHQAENIDKRSYRGAIYGVFGFGPEMYGRAMDCGYMNIHNAIFDGNELMEMSSASSLKVTGPDGNTVTWTDITALTLTVKDSIVSVTINKGNPYV